MTSPRAVQDFSMTAAAADPVDAITPLRRAMILVSVVLATTLYATTLLIVSTVLPPLSRQPRAGWRRGSDRAR
jgi:MFS transporter, DHA2 family, multidrug resistance protein